MTRIIMINADFINLFNLRKSIKSASSACVITKNLVTAKDEHKTQ
jgi:hypothetical protein